MKYELITDESGRLRVKAIEDNNLYAVNKGDIGGIVSGEYNLSQDGSCWIYYNAKVTENSHVKDDARVNDYAHCYGDSVIGGNSIVRGNAHVHQNAVLLSGWIDEDSVVCGDAVVNEYVKVFGNAIVNGEITLSGYTSILDDAVINGSGEITDSIICDDASVFGNGFSLNKCKITGKSKIYGDVNMYNRITTGGYFCGDDKEIIYNGLTITKASPTDVCISDGKWEAVLAGEEFLSLTSDMSDYGEIFGDEFSYGLADLTKSGEIKWYASSNGFAATHDGFYLELTLNSNNSLEMSIN